jgi:hypothetical protein
VAKWLAPVFIILAGVLLARAHYMLHIRKRGNWVTAVITWSATVLLVGFWTWQLTS